MSPYHEEPGFPRMTNYERYTCRNCVSFTCFDDGSIRYRTCMEGYKYKACPVTAKAREELEAIRLKSISPVEEQLVSMLKDGGPLTRDQLVQKTGVPRSTLYDGLKRLILRDEVKKYTFYETGRSRGRPQVLFALVPSALCPRW
jgi:hypothetical protein